MGRRSHTRTLSLWMNGAFVGTWQFNPRAGDVLQYAPEWVASAVGRPLSLSLPFTPGNAPHRGDKVRAYFDNLLPDTREIRERIARRYRTGSTDAFDLLAEIGRDCVGALQLLPDGTVPAGVQPIEAEPLTESQIAQVLRGTLASAPPSFVDEEEEFRISIAGAQEKTALLHYNGAWCLPHGQTPTTHILKLPLGLVGGLKLNMTESVENEWLCSLILREFGLPTAHCEPVQFEDVKALSVQRFDRMWWQSEAGDSRLIRLPQEDMCQAKGVPPAAKYEADGGPGIDSIMDTLAGSTTRDDDRRTFFQAQVLFWMLRATDGHAKNFSLFLRPEGRYQLTPLYDVLSAYPIIGEAPGKLSPFSVKMAMAVRSRNAHYKMREIQRRHWVAVGERHGVITADGRSAQYVVDDLAERASRVVQAVRERLPANFPEQLANCVLDGVLSEAEKLLG
ncbi:type II toxin-antitoxin system HipA family toxin [Cupriavidus gilardii]|uniref:type II toxin-antitoxin system HipA family toxin n=1 Tax=Cupriavidus gilardii TaxID=82541 RepID=UPI003D7675DF